LPSVLVLVYFNPEYTTMPTAQHRFLLCRHTVSYVQTQDLSASFSARQDQLLVISTLGDRSVSTIHPQSTCWQLRDNGIWM